MAAELVSWEELRRILDLDDDDERLDEIHTHSGTWVREGDHYRFIWAVTEDDRGS